MSSSSSSQASRQSAPSSTSSRTTGEPVQSRSSGNMAWQHLQVRSRNHTIMSNKFSKVFKYYKIFVRLFCYVMQLFFLLYKWNSHLFSGAKADNMLCLNLRFVCHQSIIPGHGSTDHTVFYQCLGNVSILFILALWNNYLQQFLLKNIAFVEWLRCVPTKYVGFPCDCTKLSTCLCYLSSHEVVRFNSALAQVGLNEATCASACMQALLLHLY